MDKILKAADDIAAIFNVTQEWLDPGRSEVVKILKKLVEERFTFTNSAMDAIAALKDLVSAIDRYNSNPEYIHAPWVRECSELSRARSVLQQN